MKEVNFLGKKQAQPATEESRLIFELLDTPEQLIEKQPDKESNLVSDKNLQASDLNNIITDNNANPYQQGTTEHKMFSEQFPESEKKQNFLGQVALDKLSSDWQKRLNDKVFNRKIITNSDNRKERKEPDYDQLLSSVKDHGGMQFNTYQWDFAPYLLAMRDKVQANIKPPFAFTNLGAIHGDVLVRFRVLSDGRVTKLEVIRSATHYSLDQTSTTAVSLSDPFIPLPSGFPEEYLEVTALFSYIVNKFYKE